MSTHRLYAIGVHSSELPWLLKEPCLNQDFSDRAGRNANG